MTAAMDYYFGVANSEIDKESDGLCSLSDSIWANPELCFQEKVSHNLITDFLEAKGFNVYRSYILDTAFKAEWGSISSDTEDENSEALPHVVVICEYDALPEIGHACGHNLITQVGVAAALGVKAAMDISGGPQGKLTVLGTPAEEGGCGKAYLIEAGALKGAHAALMAHPTPFNQASPQVLACRTVEVTFHGRASHASSFPEKGVNALDAAVQAYNAISNLRQHIKPEARINGVITKGGAKANVIPDLAELEYIIREETLGDLEVLCTKVEACFRAGALATGSTIDIKWGKTYKDLRTNKALVDVYKRHIQSLRADWLTHEGGLEVRGSTDMGNISYEAPSIHPMFYIGQAVNHTKDFTGVARTDAAKSLALDQGKALASTCIEIMLDKARMQEIQAEFKRDKCISGLKV